MRHRPERIPQRHPLVQDPPFELRGVRTLLVALRCDRQALERLVQRTFGWAAPHVHIEPLGAHCLLVLTDVAEARARDAQLGHFRYQEATLFVPVWGHRDGAPFVAMHAPFLYPSEGLAVAAGREIYGLPKKPAKLSVPDGEDFWNGTTPASVRVLGTRRFDGGAWREHPLLTVTAQAQSPLARAADDVLDAIDGLVGPWPGELGGWSHLFAQDLLQLKQVPDVSTGGVPPRALYRAVTRIEAPLHSLRDVRVGDASKVHVHLGDLASEPVRDVLGLAQTVTPVLAASFTMDFGFREGEVWLEQPETAEAPEGKTKVLVLGGGLGALATAHALTDTEERRRRYDVRILAQGHMLGGKGASWRNGRRSGRIEEHGLHVIFGFYHNFLRMFRNIYEEAARPEHVDPSTFDEAFAPRWRVVFHDGQDHYEVRFPRTPAGYGAGPRSLDDQLMAAGTILQSLFGGSLSDMLVGAFFPSWGNGVAGEIFAFMVTLLKGIYRDVWLGGMTWEQLDRQDFREWMHGHALPGFPDLRQTAIMQVPYDGVFAYEGPDQSKPRLSAGVAARGLLKLVSDYEKAIFFEMDMGMGEAVFAPIYEVLRDRGVKVEFFAKVEEVQMAGGEVRAVRYGRQAEVAGGPFAYDPLERVGTIRAWRADPDLSQLVRPAPIEGHDPFSDAVDAQVGDAVELRVQEDFDWVVCALPAPVTARVLRGHDTDPVLSRIGRIPTVATLHLQTWLDDELEMLGWTWRAGVLGGFRQPLNSVQENGRLLAVEGWDGPDAPRSLLYASGPFGGGWEADSTDPAAREQAERRAREEARRYVHEEYWRLLPAAASDGDPPRFEVSRLHAPWNPSEPLRDQYVRGNIDRSARYVLMVPGGLADRPPPAPPSLVNLRFAGDWTHNGIDIPSMEGTVVSALQAAASILGIEPDILW